MSATDTRFIRVQETAGGRKRRCADRQEGGRKRSRSATLVVYVGAILFAVWVLLPIWYLVVSSLITPTQLGQKPFPFIPGSITLDNYSALLTGTTDGGTFGSSDAGSRLLPAIGQSFFASTVLVVLNLVVAGLAAYGLSRYPFRGPAGSSSG